MEDSKSSQSIRENVPQGGQGKTLKIFLPHSMERNHLKEAPILSPMREGEGQEMTIFLQGRMSAKLLPLNSKRQSAQLPPASAHFDDIRDSAQ